MISTRMREGFKAYCLHLSNQRSVAAPTSPGTEFPELNERCRGWLRFMHMKTSLSGQDDDWSMTGAPHEMWDGVTAAPQCSWQRFDLHFACYAFAMMADVTPAWQEGYAYVLEGLATRYRTHWAALDFLNQFGDDKKRSEYPMHWAGSVVPTSNFRQYNAPGWTGNGLGKFPNGTPTGVQADPIRAEGMLFFKGWLVMLMSVYTRVSGRRDKFLNGAWDMANVGGTTSQWTLNDAA